MPILRGTRQDGVSRSPVKGGLVAWPHWPLFDRTRTLNTAVHCVSVSSVSPVQQLNGQVAGAPVALYGSDANCQRGIKTGETAVTDRHPRQLGRSPTWALAARPCAKRTCKHPIVKGPKIARSQESPSSVSRHRWRTRLRLDLANVSVNSAREPSLDENRNSFRARTPERRTMMRREP